MKFKNLNVNMKKLAALVLAGTMVISLSGCGKKEAKEDITIPYVETVDGRIAQYLVVTISYNKAREVYELYPTTENLNALKEATVALNESVCDEICKKIGVDFYCYISMQENGDKKYVLRELDNETNAYTHTVTSDGKSYGEINSQIILDAYGLVFNIPNKSIEKWSEEDAKKFINTADRIEANAKDVFLTDFEIEFGSIHEKNQEAKKYTK